MTLSYSLLVLALFAQDPNLDETPVESPGAQTPPASGPPPAPATEAPPPEPAPPPIPAALEGEVRNQADGTPFEDVMILVDGERVTSTDPQGRFQLRDLPPGRHLISLVGPQGQDQHTEVELGAGGLAASAASSCRPGRWRASP